MFLLRFLGQLGLWRGRAKKGLGTPCATCSVVDPGAYCFICDDSSWKICLARETSALPFVLVLPNHEYEKSYDMASCVCVLTCFDVFDVLGFFLCGSQVYAFFNKRLILWTCASSLTLCTLRARLKNNNFQTSAPRASFRENCPCCPQNYSR